MKKSWYFESLDLYPDLSLGYQIKKKLFVKKTPFQKIEICQTDKFGKILFLDGITQTTEKDEFIYHEMIVHVPLLLHPCPEKVLIIGGGDGGTLREVLKYPVREAHLVEIDKEVIKASERFLTKINQGSFQKRRARIHIGDGVKFVKEHNNEFDVIIVDSSDPIGPAKKLFSLAFYQDAYQALKVNGIFVAQSGSAFLQTNELKNNWQNAKKVFPSTSAYFADIPTYTGGLYGFVIGSKKINLEKIDFRQIERKYQAMKLKTKYYNPQIHFASFVLPNYIKKILGIK
jgi:spermidine synthase